MDLMVKRMLIDATHPEETRVVVVNGTRLEELDVETSTKKQLKGNIYLAKIVRVEPSLQAAFVEYGGNRHGFLAFSEIHPDYFQIPVADRQALIAAQKAEVLREASQERDEEAEAAEGAPDAPAADPTAAAGAESTAAESGSDEGEAGGDSQAEEGEAPRHKASAVETVGGDDESAETERRRARLLRNYKIQEVIKRRQIMLVQVVKEERGNKGAALTTYLSLAGRYCVLMPNTARGGGVSRKIVSATDRRRLKAIANEIDVPDGMAVIIRTAGSERSKTEIRRDYEYLLRMWDSVRELTLRSSAPALVYEEASLIKRSIRDLYTRDIDEVLVDGDEGYRLAKDYMRMLTPSHAKKVQPYKDPVMPLLHRYQVETQLDAMHSPTVQLKSGGYLVIAQTEALVAIDVNSGRATKERHIEETALKTNLEAADEVARQLRLRDLAGLIVIDFIDMEESRNNHAVERRLKEALKNDRARIQVGKISPFGLLELSRQRLRPSLQETSFTPCRHCGGTGLVRSIESAAVHVLRAIEEEGIRHRSSEVTVHVPTSIALYILNQKRAALAQIEGRYEFSVFLVGDDTLIAPAFRMDRVKAETRPDEAPRLAVTMDDNLAARISAEEAEDEDDAEDEEEAPADEPVRSEGAGRTEGASRTEDSRDADANGKRRRRRRRKRRGADGAPDQVDLAIAHADSAHPDDEADAADGDEEPDAAEANETIETIEAADATEPGEAGEGGETGETGDGDQPRKRRRGRRGGRRRRRREDGVNGESEAAEGESDFDESDSDDVAADDATPDEAPAVIEAPPTADVAVESPVAAVVEAPAEPAPTLDAVVEGEAEVKAEAEAAPPKRRRAPRKKAAAAEEPGTEAVAETKPAPAEKPRRTRAPRKKATEAKEAPVAEASAEPVVESAAEPVAEIPAEPVAEIPAEPVAEIPAEPVAEVSLPAAPVEVVVESPVEPVAERPAEPVSDAPPVADLPAAEPLAAAAPQAEPPAASEAEAPLPATPPRRGWWNRLS